MSKLPQEYYFFLASGIILNNRELNIQNKESYSEEELIKIFNCTSLTQLHYKFTEIEEKTIKALNLPEKDFYTLEDLAVNLNIENENPHMKP